MKRDRRAKKIDAFESFKGGMLDYFDKYKDEGKQKKSTVSHRLALSLASHFPPSLSVDIDYEKTDILIHSDGEAEVIILWSHDYLTEKDKEKALHLHKAKNPILTLAFSLIPDKDYILVYRFESNFIEYLHISKVDFSESVIRHIELNKADKNENPLLFSIKTPRKRKEAKIN